MKKLFIFTFISSFCVFSYATNRALVIGIGDYPTESGWRKINGDKDVPLVVKMLQGNGFQKDDIITLTNSQATRNNIVVGFQKLVEKSSKGDVVYIHFSGHGQRITDVDGDEGEAEFDEAWVPYDAQLAYEKGKYEGQNHLIDDQLNTYLHQIRTKIGADGNLIVIADACHSGGGSRSEEDDEEQEWVQRGCPDDFIIPITSSKSALGSNTEDWVFISACKSYQCNYEYKGVGSLTYAICQESANFPKLTATQFVQRLKARISNMIPFTQTPELNAPESLKGKTLIH